MLMRFLLRPVPLAILTVLFVYLVLPYLPTAKVGNLRLFFDYWDLTIYYAEGKWTVTNEVLFLDVKTEYPLFANLLFGAVRWFGQFLVPLVRPRTPEFLLGYVDLMAFLWIWLSGSFLLYVYLAKKSLHLNPRNLWLWVSPAPLYFALYRFDLYPVLAIFAAVWFLKENRLVPAMLMLGLCIALKGYGMIYLPALFVYLWQREGFVRSALWNALALAPFVLGNLLVLALLGMDAMLMPYENQFGRGLNGESTYDALIFLVQYVSESGAGALKAATLDAKPTLLLHAATALVSMALRPRTLEELARCFYFSTMAFISCSTFYSPQFVLWVLPFVCFIESPGIRRGTILFSLLTYLYFPVLFDSGSAQLRNIVIVLAIIRIALLFLSIKGYRSKVEITN